MRIAYVHYLRAADTARHHVRQFAEAAGALGHDVTVWPMNLMPSDDAVDGGWSSARRRLKSRLGRYLHEPKELLWNAAYVRRETRALREADADVLLVRDHFLTASCVPVARRLGVPLVLEVNAPAAEIGLYHDEYWHVPRVASWLQGWKLRHAAAATVVSTALRDHLVETHGTDARKLTIVPNGADTALFHPERPPDAEVASWACGDTLVGFIGSFHKWHGIDLLRDMVSGLLRARPRARFVSIGDGPEASTLRTGLAALGERARFVGRVEHARIPALVAALDVGVMPESNFYGSPLKVLEWMAAGKAVVAPDYGPLRDVVDDGTHGLLFRPGDRDALLAAVTRLVDDPALRRRLGVAARARAADSLSWRHNAARVLGVCETVAPRRAASPTPAGRASLQTGTWGA